MRLPTRETPIRQDWWGVAKVVIGIVLVIGLTLIPYCMDSLEDSPASPEKEGGQ